MSDQIPTTPITPSGASVGEPLATFWKSLFPWDDLNAKNVPDHWLNLGTEIMPTLSVLVAAGGKHPKLLIPDAAGRLIAAATPFVVDKITAPISPTDFHFMTDNPQLYAAGTSVMATGGTPGPPGQEVRYVTGVAPFGAGLAVFVDQQFFLTYATDSSIIIIPTTTLSGYLPIKKKFADYRNVGTIANVRGVVTFPAVPGQLYVCDSITASVVINAAPSDTPSLQVFDGAEAGVPKWFTAMNPGTAFPQVDRFSRENLNIRGSINTQMIVSFDRTSANEFQIINAGVYLENAGGGILSY